MVSIAATLVGAVFYFGEGRNLNAQKFSDVAKETDHIVPHLLNGINELVHDTEYLSGLPQIKKYMGTENGDLRGHYRNELRPFFATFLSIKKQYINVRMIDSNRNMIEFEGDRPASKAKSIDEDDIPSEGEASAGADESQPQEKASVNFKFNDYPGKKTYLSDVHLLHHDLIGSGKRMAIMDAIHSVYDGERRVGILVITLNMGSEFAELQQEVHKNPYAELYITNERGDYLVHPDKMMTFGFEDNKKFKMQEDFAKTAFFYLYPKDQKDLTFDPHFIQSEQVMNLVKVPFDASEPSRFLVVGIMLKFDQVLQQFKSIRTRSVLLAGVLVICILFSTRFFYRRLARNLNAITLAAEKYSDGAGELDLLINSNDEIGVLAATFSGMVHQINERTKRLVKSEEQSRIAKEFAEKANQQKTTLLKNLRQQKSELERISKEKDDLLAVVSHDLKNPLAVIEASLKILMEDAKAAPNTSAEKLDLMRRAQNSSKFALNLITDLLDLARLEGGIKLNYEIFMFNKVVAEATDSLLLKAKEKNISIQASVPNDLKINADYGRILQVINNIVGNAIKFTPNNGKIVINATLDQMKQAKPMLKITMSDTGIGIPKDMLARVFDKYQQVRQKDRETGTGLGLTICKNICEQHHGSITVQSEEGKGSTFIVTLPQALDMAQTAEGMSRASAVQSILIVDDDVDVTTLLMSRLKKYNYNVLCAKNGLEAIGLCQKVLPDLVLLDLEMPIMNGIETLRRLRSIHNAQKLPIIIHSNKITPENIELFRPDANDYIQKPAKMNDLLAKIQQHISSPKTAPIFETNAPAKILLTDDSDDIFALFQIFLKKTPHKLQYASSAEAGLELLGHNAFDIVFMDLNLPGMNGLEATEKLKKMAHEGLSHIRVALLTATHPDQIRDAALKAGVDMVLEKKLSKEKVLDYIEQLMAIEG